LGNVIHDLYFRDYTEKVWGLPTNSISADWAEKRIGKINRISLVKNLFNEISDNKESSRIFYYTENGIGRICDGLAGRLSGNSSIISNAKITKIDHGDHKLNYLKFEQDDEEKHLYFKNIISTIPLVLLLDYLLPLQEPAARDFKNTIRYRDLVLIFMVLNKKSILKDHWVYFPQADIPFSRLSEPKNWCPGMASVEKTSLCAELFCNSYDSLWNKKDSELVGMVINSLARNGAIAKNDLSNALVMRVPFAYPLLYLGYRENLNKVTEYLAHYKNLYLAGRNGTHSYYDLEECLDSSKNTASCLINNNR
jgi:protoporphyrinogen oxidase